MLRGGRQHKGVYRSSGVPLDSLYATFGCFRVGPTALPRAARKNTTGTLNSASASIRCTRPLARRTAWGSRKARECLGSAVTAQEATASVSTDRLRASPSWLPGQERRREELRSVQRSGRWTEDTPGVDMTTRSDWRGCGKDVIGRVEDDGGKRQVLRCSAVRRLRLSRLGRLRLPAGEALAPDVHAFASATHQWPSTRRSS